MTNEGQVKNASELFIKCENVLKEKGRAYSGDEDAHANFNRLAESLGLTKYQILSVYLTKHMDSIMRAIKRHPDHPYEETETMESRIIDAINYLAILNGMIRADVVRAVANGK